MADVKAENADQGPAQFETIVADDKNIKSEEPTITAATLPAIKPQDSIISKLFPRSYLHTFFIILAFFVVLIATTVPQGLAYGRFTTRGANCYHQSTYMKFDESVTKDDPLCATFTYPYRLIAPNAGSRFLPWFGYLIHQFGQWYLLRQSQLARDRGEISWNMGEKDESGNYRYKSEEERKNAMIPNKYAQMMFALNMGMVILKFINSQATYDGLASDVPEFSALYSVALWILFVMVIEMPRRGLFFGFWRSFPCGCKPGEDDKGVKKMIGGEFIAFVRKYHGYGISFGTTYNFWYHPMEGSPGFILGYLYQFCMILQSSFLFHPLHRNKFWTLLLELGVVPHSILIAIFFANGDPGSKFQFGFGFALNFIITQMHGFDLKVWQKCLYAAIYFAALFGSYAAVGRPFGKMAEVARMAISFLFGPIMYVIWCIGSGILYPFWRGGDKALIVKYPWLFGVLWFGVYLAHMVAFLYFGATDQESAVNRR